MDIKQVKDLSIVEYMSQDITSENIKKTIGDKTPQFITSVAALVQSDALLKIADKKSIVLACLTAAALDLPINKNLGLAFVIGYKDNNSGKTVAQFQMGYKGFIQLALRTGKFKKLNVTDVREGEYQGENRLTGDINFVWANENRDSLPVIGYVAYMNLIDGFEKSLYMTKDQLNKHGRRYSQSMRIGKGLWKDDFDAMARKTVVKLLLSKYAPMSTDLQKAAQADQALLTDEGNKYLDNMTPDDKVLAQEKESARILKHIKESKTIEELEKCQAGLITDDLKEAYDLKFESFK